MEHNNNLSPEQELHARRILAGMSPLELLFYAARVNPKSRFNRHQSTYNYAMGRHIVARKERAIAKRRKANQRITPR